MEISGILAWLAFLVGLILFALFEGKAGRLGEIIIGAALVAALLLTGAKRAQVRIGELAPPVQLWQLPASIRSGQV